MTDTINTSQPATFYMKVESRMVKIVVVPSDDGDGFNGSVPALRGVYSFGDTREEAFANTEAALRAVLETYRDDGEPVPWGDESDTVREVVIEVHP